MSPHLPAIVGEGDVSSCFLGLLPTGAPMLGSPSDKYQLSPHSMKFFLFRYSSKRAPSPGPILPTVLGARRQEPTKKMEITFYWGKD